MGSNHNGYGMKNEDFLHKTLTSESTWSLQVFAFCRRIEQTLLAMVSHGHGSENGGEGIAVILFDVGGVLSREIIDEKLADLALKHGVDPGVLLSGKGELRSRADLGEIGDMDFWRLVLERAGVRADEEDLGIGSYMALVPGTLDLARKLKARCRVAILSNDSHEMSRARRDLFGFDAVFDPVLISAEIGLIKPDPRIYDHAIERLGVAASRIVFVDNAPANVEAALARGMRGIVFQNARQLEAELRGLGVTTQ